MRPQTKELFEMWRNYQGDHWEPSRPASGAPGRSLGLPRWLHGRSLAFLELHWGSLGEPHGLQGRPFESSISLQQNPRFAVARFGVFGRSSGGPQGVQGGPWGVLGGSMDAPWPSWGFIGGPWGGLRSSRGAPSSPQSRYSRIGDLL